MGEEEGTCDLCGVDFKNFLDDWKFDCGRCDSKFCDNCFQTTGRRTKDLLNIKIIKDECLGSWICDECAKDIENGEPP